MVKKKRPKARPTPEPTLPTDRCPNCDGPLKIISDQPEALCPACGIYVEVLRPLVATEAPVESGPDAVRRRRDLAKFYLTYEDLEEELTDVEAEVQEEIEKPEPGEASEPTVQEAVPSTATALPPAEVPPPPETTPPVPVEVPAPIPLPSPEPTPEPEEIVPPPSPEPPEVIVESERAPGEAEAGSIVEDAGSGGTTELIVKEPPYWARYPEEPAPETWVEEAVEREAAAAAAEAEAPSAVATLRRADRVIFYVGATNVAFGGSGLLLGSVLHDMFRVPFMGQAYEAFGPLNLTAALFGAIFLAVGLGVMAFGARRGSRRKERAAGG